MSRFTSVCSCAFVGGLLMVSASHGQGQCQKGGGGMSGGPKGGMAMGMQGGGGMGMGMGGMAMGMQGGGGGMMKGGMGMQRPMPMQMHGQQGMNFMAQKPQMPMQMQNQQQMQQMQQQLQMQQMAQQQQQFQQQQQMAQQQQANFQQPMTQQDQIQAYLRNQSEAALKKDLNNPNLYVRLMVGEELKRRGANSAAIDLTTSASLAR